MTGHKFPTQQEQTIVLNNIGCHTCDCSKKSKCCKKYKKKGIHCKKCPKI